MSVHMNRLNPVPPPLKIDAAYLPFLQNIALQAMPHAPDVARRLYDELDRADVVPSGEMPADVVTLGSLVTYRDESCGSIRSIKLVAPGDADLSRARISIVSPIGAALIGLAEGQSMEWEIGGEIRSLYVIRVRTV